ncbi:MAG: hypothetical protein ACOVS5_11465, partial [Oligoflexus sp.]
ILPQLLGQRLFAHVERQAVAGQARIMIRRRASCFNRLAVTPGPHPPGDRDKHSSLKLGA